MSDTHKEQNRQCLPRLSKEWGSRLKESSVVEEVLV